ncbi:MAG: hypothetical protein R2878_10810 [Thermoleophilia bacterium]
MQIRQFTGTSVDEVLKQIRAELGEEAVIIQTRRVVRGGLGGFFGRELIEVTAADRADEDGAADYDNRIAAASVLDVHDDDDLPNPFSSHLQSRLAAATEAEAGVSRAPGAGPAASAASTYARSAAPTPQRPFAPAGPERTEAIIAAAREAMRSARDARQDDRVTATPPSPARAPGAVPTPPPFIPADRGGMRVIQDRQNPAIGRPVWERLDAADVAAAPAAPVPPAAGPAVERITPAEPAPPPAAAVVESSPARVPEPAPTAPVVDADVETYDDPIVEEPADDRFIDTIGDPSPLQSVGARTTPARPGSSDRALDAVRSELLGAGVDARYLEPFLQGFTTGAMPFLDASEVRDAVRRWLASRLPVPRDWKGRQPGQMMAFVGQSGVGKTSVVTALAERLGGREISVALIAAGGLPDPELSATAQRLGLPLATVDDAEQLAAARAELADHDLIVVDTPGRSHKNLEDMEDLGALLGTVRPEEVHLVLPVATHIADLGDVSRRFRIAGVNRLTLTKLDETRFLGNLVNIPLRMLKPVSLLSEGAGRHGVVMPADPSRIAELLLP